MRLIDANKIHYEPMLSARGNGQYEDVMVAYKDQIDDLPTIEPERPSGREVYQAGYAEGYKAGRARMLCDIPVSPLLEKQKKDPTGKRLIDANNLIEYVWRERLDTRERIAHLVESMPTIEERKSGKWEHGRETSRTYLGKTLIKIWYEDWHCNRCGLVVECSEKPAYKFCPLCGASMMEGGKDSV